MQVRLQQSGNNYQFDVGGLISPVAVVVDCGALYLSGTVRFPREDGSEGSYTFDHWSAHHLDGLKSTIANQIERANTVFVPDAHRFGATRKADAFVREQIDLAIKATAHLTDTHERVTQAFRLLRHAIDNSRFTSAAADSTVIEAAGVRLAYEITGDANYVMD